MAIAPEKLTEPRITLNEFLQRPEDGRKYEFVDGEAREVPTGFDHDVIGAILVALLMPHTKGRGYVTLSQAGFRMTNGSLRSPDVGFTRKERLPEGKPIKGFPNFAPDLAVEIISPLESRPDMQRKLEEYFASGAEQVRHIFPETQQVIVYSAPTVAKTYTANERVPGGALLPGFDCFVSDLFLTD